jgi:endoglucanase
MTRRIAAITIATCTTLATLTTPAAAGAPAAPTTPRQLRPAEIRVNQVGYAPDAAKVAFVMLPGRVASVRFTITSGGRTVFRGVSRDDAGAWNSGYGAVYELNFNDNLLAASSGSAGR